MEIGVVSYRPTFLQFIYGCKSYLSPAKKSIKFVDIREKGEVMMIYDFYSKIRLVHTI
jgi:hypothetical protein